MIKSEPQLINEINPLQKIPMLLVVTFLFFSMGCHHADQKVQLNPDDPPFEKLSMYHFFRSPLQRLVPADRVLPYELITPLFSDYAQKARFIWMPEGVSASIEPSGDITFAEGTVLIKNFYYDHSNDIRQLVETRLLVKRKSGWDPLTYIWNDGQTEAFLEIAGDFKNISAKDDQGESFTIDYLIPNKNQCKSCHERDRKLVPAGPVLKNLNRDFLYADGLENQLVRWSSMHFLTGYDPERDTTRMTDWADAGADLHDRALAYLEVNCGTCHRAGGPAYVSGLRLTSDETNLFNLGVYKPPVSAGKGSGGRGFDIVPGNPDASIMVYRMQSLEPGAMMPELGRKLVHKEGVALIRNWIASMPQASESQARTKQ